jgi:hypothetical protein
MEAWLLSFRVFYNFLSQGKEEEERRRRRRRRIMQRKERA